MRNNAFAIALICAAATTSTGNAAPSAAALEAGGNLFAITCSSSFCHGDAGIGARGPSLRNRNFPPDFVRNTMLNGRSGTPMPAFKDALTPVEVAMIVNYVMSLSPGNHQEDGGTAAAATSAPIDLSNQAIRGSDLFFGAVHPAGCALCHSYGGKGGPIGPDLSAVAAKTPSALYRSITQPAPSNDGYAAVTVTTKDGSKFAGLKHDQTDQQVGLFDVSTTPPVLRSFYFADGIKTEAYAGAALYRHDLSGYSKSDVTDIIAFLKSATGEGKAVTPQELGLQ